MSTIAELEADVVRLRDAAKEADLAYRNAVAALQDARNAASGIMGHVLEWTERHGYGMKRREVKRRMVVKRVSTAWRGETRAYGIAVLANGEIGARQYDVEVSKTTDLGPYKGGAT